MANIKHIKIDEDGTILLNTAKAIIQANNPEISITNEYTVKEALKNYIGADHNEPN